MILSIADYRPPQRFDGNPFTEARVEGTTDLTLDWTEIQTFDLDPVDADPTEPQPRSFTMEDVASDVAYLRVTFIDAEAGQVVTDPIPVAPSVGLATTRDVRLRVGRELSEDEAAQVGLLIRLATITIYGAIGRPSTWTPASDAFDYLNMLAIEMVARTFSNPDSLFAFSESVGAYSYTRHYNRNAPSLSLTQSEELAARNAVYGSNMATILVESQADEYADLIAPFWPVFYGYLPGADDNQPMFIYK